MNAQDNKSTRNSNDGEFMSPRRKAAELNGEGAIFGSFAEIGAGQEVVRTFFEARQASQTIAKTISAYAMAVSDAVYLANPSRKISDPRFVRYTARFRLLAMLEHEQKLMHERFCTYEQIENFKTEVRKKRRPRHPRLFAFANTMASGEYHGGHEIFGGWMGVRMQGQCVPSSVSDAGEKESSYVDFIIHVILLETERSGQRETIGRMGVNLIYESKRSFDKKNGLKFSEEEFADSLFEGIEKWKARVDVIEINPSSDYRDDSKIHKQYTRQLSFMAVEKRLSHDVLFTPYKPNIPSELYNKRIGKDLDADFYKSWRQSLQSVLGDAVDEWTYPQDDVSQFVRFEACKDIYLVPGFIKGAGKRSTISISPEADKYLNDDPTLTSAIKIIYIPLETMERLSDEITYDYEKFNRAYENWRFTSKNSAVLVTRSGDLGWISETIQRSYRSALKIIILLDIDQWDDVLQKQYANKKAELRTLAKQAENEGKRGLKGELQREVNCLSNGALDCLQRTERAGCSIRVLGTKQHHDELIHYVEHLMKQQQLHFDSR